MVQHPDECSRDIIVVNGVRHIGCVVCEAGKPSPEVLEKLRQLLPPIRRKPTEWRDGTHGAPGR